MSGKCWLLIMIVGMVFVTQGQGLGILKKKLKAAALPVVAAKLAVLSDVKAKAVAAATAKVTALKAKGAAVKAVALAPLVLTKKVVGVKLGALKALKAAKVAKVAKLKSLLLAKKASKIIIPTGPIAVIPIKTFPSTFYSHPVVSKLPSFSPQGLVKNFISGAQSTLEAVGNNVPFLSTFQNGLSNSKLYLPPPPAEVTPPAPVYGYPSNVEHPSYVHEVSEPHTFYETPSSHLEVPPSNSVVSYRTFHY